MTGSDGAGHRASRTAELDYAARERSAADLERFEGGEVLTIGSALTLVPGIILIVILV